MFGKSKLNRQNSELKLKNKKLQQKNQELASRVLELESDAEKTSKDASDYQEEIDRLKKQNHAAQSQLENQKDYDKLKAQAKIAKKEAEKLFDENKHLEDKIKAYKSELAEKEKKIEILSEKQDKDCSALEKELKQANHDREQTEKSFDKVLSKLGYVLNCINNEQGPNMEKLKDTGRLPADEIKYTNPRVSKLYHSVNSFIDYFEECLCTLHNSSYFAKIKNRIDEMISYLKNKDVKSVSELTPLADTFDQRNISNIPYRQIAKKADKMTKAWIEIFLEYQEEFIECKEELSKCQKKLLEYRNN